MNRRRDSWGSIVAFVLSTISLSFLAIYSSQLLPQPVLERKQVTDLSEAAILENVRVLSETIGFRTVGTREHAEGDKWMVQQVEALKQQCDDSSLENIGRQIECEFWHQVGDGSHRFDLMNKRLYKHYVNLTNIVFRISAGTAASKEHAVLVNSHLDSTLPSPGAADDAISVAVMIECIRALIASPEFQPSHSLIFLFNNAEESLQDGSHLYSTQHITAPSVRAVINLEAAGSTGPELLFQATSQEMIDAYSRVPYPFGTILANEIFASGILMSDTDFRQFQLYLNTTGLDMAVVGHSYFYHTRKDLVKYIEPGVAQHMAANTMALLRHMSSPESPLPRLVTGYTRPTTVFFSLLGKLFVSYSFTTATICNILLLGGTLIFLTANGTLLTVATGLRSPILALLGALTGSIAAAVVMEYVLGRGFSWYRNEWWCLVLYGFPALTGALASQTLINVTEVVSLHATLLLLLGLATSMQALGFGTSQLFTLEAAPMLVAVFLEAWLTRGGPTLGYSLWTYTVGQSMSILLGVQVVCGVVDVFVPLTGRMGPGAPAEIIIAVIATFSGAITLPSAIPFALRFGRNFVRRSIPILLALSVGSMAVFSTMTPFDNMHIRRIFILHSENITSGDTSLHVAAGDRAPGFPDFVTALSEYVAPDSAPYSVQMDDWNSDWDTIYPFSTVLQPYKLNLTAIHRGDRLWKYGNQFRISTVNDLVDADSRTRSLTILIKHTGIIWTTIAFDAHVLRWSLDNDPPDEYARHHVKEASFYGNDFFSLDITIRLPPSENGSVGLNIDFTGVKERSMWPGKIADRIVGDPAMELFSTIDPWIIAETKDSVDALLLGTIVGSTVI